jgi:CsbD-like
MDKDRVEGAAHRIKGAVKEAVGKVTGDAKTQAEGAAPKAVSIRAGRRDSRPYRCGSPGSVPQL